MFDGRYFKVVLMDRRFQVSAPSGHLNLLSTFQFISSFTFFQLLSSRLVPWLKPLLPGLNLPVFSLSENGTIITIIFAV